jgi:hypothetical protein
MTCRVLIVALSILVGLAVFVVCLVTGFTLFGILGALLGALFGGISGGFAGFLVFGAGALLLRGVDKVRHK